MLSMTKIDPKKIIEHLDKRWKDKTCPVCHSDKWSLGDQIFEIREFNEGNLIVDSGPIFPVIPIVCDSCGNVVLLNAIKAGFLENKKDENSK